MPLFISTIKQGGDYEVEVRNSLYSSQYEFMTEIKEKYKSYIGGKLENPSDEIFYSGIMEKIYENTFAVNPQKYPGFFVRFVDFLRASSVFIDNWTWCAIMCLA